MSKLVATSGTQLPAHWLTNFRLLCINCWCVYCCSSRTTGQSARSNQAAASNADHCNSTRARQLACANRVAGPAQPHAQAAPQQQPERSIQQQGRPRAATCMVCRSQKRHCHVICRNTAAVPSLANGKLDNLSRPLTVHCCKQRGWSSLRMQHTGHCAPMLSPGVTKWENHVLTNAIQLNEPMMSGYA